MARRPSTISTTSLVSSNARVESGPSDYFEGSLSNVNGRARLPSRTSPIKLAKYQTDDRPIDPDELFTQCTVAEVKAFQLQLRFELRSFALQLLTGCRTDADAKQEELRLMVGCVCRVVNSFQKLELPRIHAGITGSDIAISYRLPLPSYPLHDHPNMSKTLWKR